MKKLILTLIVVFITMTSFSQIVGYDLSTAKDINQLSAMEYETLLKNSKDFYCVIYKQNTIGYKHMINDAYKLFKENGQDLFNPNNIAYGVTLSSYVEGLIDYESAHASIYAGDGEVIIVSDLDNGWRLGVWADEDVYCILMVFTK